MTHDPLYGTIHGKNYGRRESETGEARAHLHPRERRTKALSGIKNADNGLTASEATRLTTIAPKRMTDAGLESEVGMGLRRVR